MIRPRGQKTKFLHANSDLVNLLAAAKKTVTTNQRIRKENIKINVLVYDFFS